jgi:hypothetical protein
MIWFKESVWDHDRQDVQPVKLHLIFLHKVANLLLILK